VLKQTHAHSALGGIMASRWLRRVRAVRPAVAGVGADEDQLVEALDLVLRIHVAVLGEALLGALPLEAPFELIVLYLCPPRPSAYGAVSLMAMFASYIAVPLGFPIQHQVHPLACIAASACSLISALGHTPPAQTRLGVQPRPSAFCRLRFARAANYVMGRAAYQFPAPPVLARVTGSPVIAARSGPTLTGGDMRDDELWRAGGFSSFDDYAERGIDVSRTTAYKLMRVAREFNAAIAERYGVEKLDLGLRYLDGTPADERPGDLLASQIRLRDERGRWVTVPFHRAKTREIRDAIALLDDSRQARRRVSVELGKRARRLADALPPPPAGVSAGARVRLRRARDGRVAVTFTAIPLDALEAFLEAVRAHLL
jgi:hypothetical protein